MVLLLATSMVWAKVRAQVWARLLEWAKAQVWAQAPVKVMVLVLEWVPDAALEAQVLVWVPVKVLETVWARTTALAWMTKLS
jgi:hypothetical protein